MLHWFLCEHMYYQCDITIPSFMAQISTQYAGAFGGICGVLVGAPLDIAAVRLQQAGCVHQNTLQCFKSIIQTEGPRALLKGISYPMLTVPLQNSIAFQAFGFASRYFEANQSRGTSATEPSDDSSSLPSSTASIAYLPNERQRFADTHDTVQLTMPDDCSTWPHCTSSTKPAISESICGMPMERVAMSSSAPALMQQDVSTSDVRCAEGQGSEAVNNHMDIAQILTEQSTAVQTESYYIALRNTLAAGCFAGAMQTVVTVPQELLKIRVQVRFPTAKIESVAKMAFQPLHEHTFLSI